MDEIEEHIIIHTNRKIKSKVRVAVVALLILPLCYKLFGPQVGLIVGFILLGVGLGEMTTLGWGLIGAIVLIIIGLSIILGGIFRRRK